MSAGGPIICVVGPTATGKSELAQRIACDIGGEIVSADSMQIYRGMDIGTAKVPVAKRLVPHHGIDLVDPGIAYSVALYQDYARDVFARLDGANKRSVLVGGSGFYVRAAIDAYDFPKGEQEGNPVRERWMAFLEREGAAALWEALRAVDARSADAIHPNNAKRVVRALEMHEEGVSYADQVEALATIGQYRPTVMIGLDCERELLKRRIDERVDIMREQGLEEEVRDLLHKGYRGGLTSQHAIGYKEIVDALDGNRTLDEAFEDIKRATKRYAKRQRTWFRRDGRIHWLDCSDADGLEERALGIIAEATAR